MGKGSVSSASIQTNRRETKKSRGHDRAQALRAMLGDASVVYAIRCHDGAIKIGCSTRLWLRVNEIGGEIIGFRLGDLADEKTIHESLRAHRMRGHEYYHSTPAVLAVVNDMRAEWNLPAVWLPLP